MTDTERTENPDAANEKIPMRVKLSYGCGDIFAGGAFLLVATLFMYFLTQVVGLDAKLAGTVILLGRLWDAVTDPVMGFLSDRTHTRFGRRRIYFISGLLPIFLFFSMLWFPVDLTGQGALFAYYTIAYLLFGTVFTMVQVPYTALLPDLTPSYKERASISGIRLTFSALSAIAAGTLVATFDQPSGCSAWLFVFLGTYERPDLQRVQPSGGFRPFTEMITTLRNRTFRHHAGIFIGSQTAVDFLTALAKYYVIFVLLREGEFMFIMAALLIVPVFMMPVWIQVARRFRKTTPMNIGLVVWAAALLASLLIPAGSQAPFIYIVAALSGVGTSASVFVPWSILPEVTDVDEIITGQRREGVYGGISTFLRKMAGGLALFVLGFLLDAIGFIEQAAAQTPETVAGLRLMFALVPTVFILIALYFSFRYGGTEHRHGLLMAEIRRRKSGGPAAEVPPEARQVCETLTGMPYSRLWRQRE